MGDDLLISRTSAFFLGEDKFVPRFHSVQGLLKNARHSNKTFSTTTKLVLPRAEPKTKTKNNKDTVMKRRSTENKTKSKSAGEPFDERPRRRN